ncbi:MAG: ABC transporter ATP-binding protein [Bryobacteraceae bacterium]
MEEERVHGRAFDRCLMLRLGRYALPYWPAIVASAALMLINSALQVIGPLISKLAVDRYLAPSAHAEPSMLDPYLSSDAMTGLAQLSAIVLGGLVLGLLCSFIQGYLMARTGQLAMFALRRDLMHRLHGLDMAYYDRQPVGRLVTRVTTDVDALNELLSSGSVAMLGDVVVLSFLLASMLRLSVGMTVALMLTMPLVLGATLLFRKIAQTGNRRVRIAVARINSFLQEHVTGMSVVQLFNREQKAREQFDKANREHYDAFQELIRAYGWFYPVVELVGVLGLALVIGYGGWRIEQGTLTMGVLVAFFQYGVRFFRPIQDLSEKYNILQSAMAAAERVFGLLDERASVEGPAKAVEFPRGTAAIEFDRVWFAYKGEDWVLRDVSFRVEPGETIAVVGHTGAGKTTITSLLLRLYDVQKGAIRIGGVDLREFDPRDLRRAFGIVLQDPFLFTGDIAHNIRLGTPGIDDEQVRAAAREVNLLDFVDSLPGGLRHEVRERGAGLSTGQKQLISFARALAHAPRFLILDEATSSVDTETELRIRAALDRLLEGRTSIVIAHRLSTIQRADRILVMHKGELRESGSHQELLAQRGIYWRLYQLQYKDQEAAK